MTAKTAEALGTRSPARQQSRKGHGWWPYVLPYMCFLLTGEVTARFPESWGLAALILKPLVPGALMIHFALRGEYPELRGVRFRPGWICADVLVGLALAALWMGPYVFIEAIRPADAGFDPTMLGEDRVALVLALRMLGYGLVTPFFEEIFIRDFVMRYSEVFKKRVDWRDVPLAYYTRVSFVSTIVLFTMGHLPWEYWVAVPWVVLSTLWFYWRKDLYAVITLHAATNVSMLVFVATNPATFTKADGSPLSLWFFI